MTLKQLEYAVTAAEKRSITEAAKELFIAQPSLTSAIHELENEIGITIFYRLRNGIELTKDGDEFLGYARQVLEQTNLINERYKGKSIGKYKFFVSSQHYSFVVEAFVELLKRFDSNKYEFHMRETQTYEIIEDVSGLKSEIGVLYINRFNQTVIRKTIRDNNLIFTKLFTAKPHVFIGKNSPLSEMESISLEDLKPFPRLSYEQGSHNSFYFSEEILSTADSDKDIVVCDRATLFNLLVGLNGYTLCSGVISEELNGSNIIAKPLGVDDYMEIGYILPSGIKPSPLTTMFIEVLQEITKSFDKK